MNAPSNPYEKDAEAAGKYAVAAIRQSHKAYRHIDVDTIYWLAVWAFHWARLAQRVTTKAPPPIPTVLNPCEIGGAAVHVGALAVPEA